MPQLTWAQPKTLAEWRERTINSLGGYHFNTELDDRTIDHAIWQTLTLFNKYRPKWEWLSLGAIQGDTQIDLSDLVDLGTRVKDVKFINYDHYSQFRMSHSPFHIYNHNQYFGVRNARRSFQRLVALERYDFLLGTHPTWRYIEETRTLMVSNKGYWDVYVMALVLKPLVVEDIPFHLENDFLQGVVGYTKLILARILGKFGPIPGAQGNIPTDATTLRTEGQNEIKELDRKLDRNLRHMPPKPIF